jgi:hypothetical protein
VGSDARAAKLAVGLVDIAVVGQSLDLLEGVAAIDSPAGDIVVGLIAALGSPEAGRIAAVAGIDLEAVHIVLAAVSDPDHVLEIDFAQAVHTVLVPVAEHTVLAVGLAESAPDTPEPRNSDPHLASYT